jgi:hypothetical protein
VTAARGTPLDFDGRVVDARQWRRWRIAGELVLARAERDPAFKARMLEMLDRRVNDPDDRALFGLPPIEGA